MLLIKSNLSLTNVAIVASIAWYAGTVEETDTINTGPIVFTRAAQTLVDFCQKSSRYDITDTTTEQNTPASIEVVIMNIISV